MPSRSRSLLPWTLLLAVAGCKEGESQFTDFLPVVPSDAGTQACAPLAVSAPTATPVFTHASIGPLSQIAAVAGEETLYWTGSDGSIHELVFPIGGGPPVDAVLVAPGTIESSYLVPAGILAPARLSGIALLDEGFLVVAEHASNTILFVERDVPNSVGNLAGRRDADGGFSSGVGGNVRFHFSEPAPLFADAAGFVYVGDSENHALRRVQVGAVPETITLVGTGAPGSSAGAFAQTRLDTPSGMAASCGGELLLVESGAAGAGGHRLVSLRIGGQNIFDELTGSTLVLAGNGASGTVQGVGSAAGLAAPVGLVSSTDDQLFWIDSTGGILRRFDAATGLADCPMFADCATAVASPSSFGGGTAFSIAIGDSGALYVLGALSQTLYQVGP